MEAKSSLARLYQIDRMNQKVAELAKEAEEGLNRLGYELEVLRGPGERSEDYFERLRRVCNGSGTFSVHEVPTSVQGKRLVAV